MGSKIPNIDALKVGDTLTLAGLFLGVSNEPVLATLTEKHKQSAHFSLTYHGVFMEYLFAVKNDKGHWSWEI